MTVEQHGRLNYSVQYLAEEGVWWSNMGDLKYIVTEGRSMAEQHGRLNYSV